MTTKQTAVEWLEDNLAEKLKHIIESKDYVLMETLFEQAKQMEKEQTIEFANRYGFDVCAFDYDRADEYYERTYKQQDNEGL
jgi:hypothetical protein